MRKVFMPERTRPRHVGLEVIGVLKLISGATALLVGFGVIRFLGHDPGPRAERIVSHLGLDPHNFVIHAALERITGIDRTRLRALEAGTFFYAALHTIEGVGLILGYQWAEYLVIVATGSLIPFEIFAIARRVSVVRVAIFVLNVAIVIYLIINLFKDRLERSHHATDRPGPEGGDTAPMGGR
jgi:uncharacterized membrane protein (DUF2068 family)